MNWSDLQIFVAVARVGRVSAAARRLGVQHTTVARRIAALEGALGVPLFYKTRAGFLLTPHGHALLPQAEAMERAAISAAAHARAGSGVVRGRVRVAMPPELASHWLAPRLKSFCAAHPQVELQILVGTRQRDLSRGEADLAVQDTQPRQAGMVAVRLGRVSFGLYAARTLAGRKPRQVTDVAAMNGAPLLAFTPPFRVLQNAKWFQPIRDAAPVALTSNSTEALLAATRAGVGIGVLPRLAAQRFDDLVAVSANVAEHDLLLVIHPEVRRDPNVRAAAEFLKKLAREPNGLL